MFKKLSKTYNAVKAKLKARGSEKNINNSSLQNKAVDIPKSLAKIKENLLNVFEACDDLILREVQLGTGAPIRIVIAYIKGLINTQVVNTDIVKAITIYSKTTNWDKKINNKTLITGLIEELLPANNASEVTDFNATIDKLLSGSTIIYVDRYDHAIQVYTKKERGRNVEQPINEIVIRGPREAFVESLETNLSLIRRIIKNPKLKIEIFQYGTKSNTNVSICYLKGTADELIVRDVKTRLNKMQVDAVLDTGYIEQYIEDNPFSVFPTVGNSEKPDKIASKILEGRIAILCDGTPTVLTVPFLFIESFHNTDDYYSRFPLGSFNRLLKIFALIFSISMPGIYVAFIAFHANVIPIKLLLSINNSREGVPFTPFVEALLLSTAFELLKEAGLRIPRPFGQSISIVGALIIGDAAVKAGLVSDIMVIIIAITGMSSFIVPPAQDSMHILRVSVMIAANILGFLGISLVLITLLIHMCSLKSFGVPYMAPFAPMQGMSLKDSIIRFPIRSLNNEKTPIQRID